MNNPGFTTEEFTVTTIRKRYTCTECGFKVESDPLIIRQHCARHKIEKIKKDTLYKAPVPFVKETEGRGFEVSYIGSAVFQSEEQAEELCYLLDAVADYYMPTMAEVTWEGPGKYYAVSVKTGGMGETYESIKFTKEKV